MGTITPDATTIGQPIFEGYSGFSGYTQWSGLRSKNNSGDPVDSNGAFSHMGVALSAQEMMELQSLAMYQMSVQQDGGGAMKCINRSGETLLPGPVCANGWDTINNCYTIYRVDLNHNRPANMILKVALTNGSFGVAYVGGLFKSTLNTSSLPIGSEVYIGFSSWSGFSGLIPGSEASGVSGWSVYSAASNWSGFSDYSAISAYSGYWDSGASGGSGWSGYSAWSTYSGMWGPSSFSGVSGTYQSQFSGYTQPIGYVVSQGVSGNVYGFCQPPIRFNKAQVPAPYAIPVTTAPDVNMGLDGDLVVDTAHNKLYVKYGGAWHYTALT